MAFLNATSCMTYSLLMLVEDARDHHMEGEYSRPGLMTALQVAMSVSSFTPSCCGEYFYYL